MRKKFVQFAAFCLALGCLMTVVSASYSPSSDSGGSGFGSAGSGGSDYGDSGFGDSGFGDSDSGDDGSGGAGSGDVGSGDVGSGDVGSGDVGSGDAGSGDVGSGDAGSGDAGSGDVGSGDTGADEDGSGDTGSEDTEPENPEPEASEPVYIDPELKEQVIRVGLYYGSDALDGANLKNYVGSGFSFGYYNGDNAFVALGYTSETEVSVVKTTNVYYGTYNGYTSYHDDITSSVAVGCYHLELPEAYYSFEDAQRRADQYSNLGAFVAYIDGSYRVRIGNYTKRDQAVNAMNTLAVSSQLVGTSEYGVSVVITGTNTIVFQYDDSVNGTGLGVEAVSVNGAKTQTWFKGYKWFGGFRYERINGGDLTVANFVDMEDYANCVISREMSDSWPLEALKAQAVAARSYAVTLNRHAAYRFDLCCTTCCQAYHGTALIGANTARAVEETAGQYIWYGGEVARAFYSASNGGASEDVSVVWGSNQSLYPYLAGVIDPYEATVTISDYAYTKEFTPAELASKLKAKGYNCNNITDAYVSEYTATGNPKTVTFVDSAGKTYTLNTRTVKSMLGLRSYRYDFGTGEKEQFSVNGAVTVTGMSGLVAVDGNGNLVSVTEGAYVITDQGISQTPTGNEDVTNSNGNIVISGKGNGHNVGMSQQGARAMALQGYTYDQILTFYYTGVTVG